MNTSQLSDAENRAEKANFGGSVMMDFTASFKKGSTSGQKPWLLHKNRAAAEKKEDLESDIVTDTIEDDEGCPSLADICCDTSLVCDALEGDSPVVLELGGMNNRLDQLGYDQLDPENTESVISIVNSLLKDIRVANESISSYQAASHRSSSDIKRLQHDKESITLQVQCLKQDLAALQNQYTVAVNKAKKDKQTSEAWNKELQVSLAKKEGQQKGWQASLNRKEMEYEKLRKRMQLMQSQRDRSIKRTMEMSTPPQHLSSWALESCNDSIDDDESIALRNAVETSAERKVQLLNHENSKLREALASLQGVILSKLRGKATKTLVSGSLSDQSNDGGESQLDDNVSSLTLSDETFSLPAEELTLRIESMRTKVENLVDVWETRDTDATEEADRKCLLENLQEAKAVIAEQDQLLRSFLFRAPSTSQVLQDIDIDEEFLEKQRQAKALQSAKQCETPKQSHSTTSEMKTPSTPERGNEFLPGFPDFVPTPATKALVKEALDVE